MTLWDDFHAYPYGPEAWLLQTKQDGAPSEVTTRLHQLNTYLEKAKPEEIREWTLGYNSVLIEGHSTLSHKALERLLSVQAKESIAKKTARIREIPTHYNGPDLQELGTLTGLSTDEIVKIHSSATYTVRFLGFTPGFAYLDGLDARLHVPRRDIPRERMEAGAIAIGGAHAGIYSIPSPGGWHWLGSTETLLFNKEPNDLSAFLLHIGDTVRFIPT